MNNIHRWISMLAFGIWVAASAAPDAEARGLAYTNPPLQRGPADPRLPSITILEAEKAPVVDGVLDDPCWAKAQESHVFTDEYSFPLKLKTTFKICQKDEVIYLAIRCRYDEKGGKKTGGDVEHDGALWNGENIEIFMDPDNEDTPGYYQFVLTPFDITGDFYNNEPRDPEKRWEPTYQVKSTWSDKEWTIEYGIPLAVFDRTKTIYENFGMNVHRVDVVYGGVGAWSPGHGEGFNFPHKFGEVRGLKGKAVQSNAPGLFRSPYLKVNDRVIKARATPSLVPEKKPELAAGPTVKAAGSAADIVFEVNTRTDVAVWIEDAKGESVRHLAAGMLGSNAPAPLVKNSLKQNLRWDYMDDWGKKVAPGKYKVKVGVGSKAVLDKELGRVESPSQINGIAVDGQGFFYTYEGYLDQWSRIMKYDRNGKFASMLMPPPADVPVEKLKGMNIIDYGPDGQARFGSRGLATTMPHLDEPMPQTLAINSRGQLIFFGGEYQGGPARFYKINADGSLPDDFVGPYLTEINWLVYFDNWAKRFHFALDPLDEDVIYLSGLKEIHRSEGAVPPSNPEVIPGKRETFCNAVCRIRWGKDAPLDTFIGKPNTHGTAGSDKLGEFFDPQGIAFDKDNNLWVCDRRNNRLQVFNHAGKFLWQIKHAGPYEVRISRKTGERYVLGIEGDSPTNYVGTITKYSSGTKPNVLARGTLPGIWNYWWTMALDDSGKRPELKLVWTGNMGDNIAHGGPNHSKEAYRILRVIDNGNSFSEPEMIVGKEPPREYYRIVAGWESDIIAAGSYWIDANSGRDLGRMNAKELQAARDGRWVTRNGFDCETISVFPQEWATNPAAKALTNWPLVPPSLTRAGERGFTVAPNSDVYVARYYQWTYFGGMRGGMEGSDHHVAIDRYSIDGKLIGKRVVYELSGGAHSPAVDIKGNIYVCDNFGRKLGQFYEDDIASNMPSWSPDYQISAADWETLRSGKTLYAGYRKFTQNPLFRSVGVIYKFSPKGGGLLWRAGQGEYKQYWPQTNAAGKVLYPDWGYPFKPKPTRPATHWSATMLDAAGRQGMFPAWTEGVEWEFLGASPARGRYTKGHDACICFNLRFCVDDFGRTYVPAAHRNTIRMIDTAGNEVLRIGRYGNLDSGPTARLKEPDIPLRFPTSTALSKRYLYVVEQDIARVLRIKMGYEQERDVEVAVR